MDDKDALPCTWCGNKGEGGPVQKKNMPDGTRKPLCVGSYACVKRRMEKDKAVTHAS